MKPGKICIFIFRGSWKGGEMCGRKKLNRYRKCEIERDCFLEVKTKNGIFICDREDKHLLIKYNWRIINERNNRKCVKSSIRKNGKSTSLMFRRMVLGDVDGQITHKDNDPLNNRRSNLKIIKAPKRYDLDFIVKSVDKELIAKSLDSVIKTSWFGGKLGGSLNKFKKYYRVAFQSPPLQKTFFFSTFGSKRLAYNEARIFHVQEAIERGLVRNKTRFHTTDYFETFIEVMCNDGKTFFCDKCDIPLLESRVWSIKKRSDDTDVYEAFCSKRTNFKATSFHKALGLYEITDHIDGNPLNNRRCNLRDGTKMNARNYSKRSDNVSRVTGVSFSENKHAWIVQWPEGGKRRWKTFTIIDGKRTNEQAKRLAIDFRKEKDFELGLHDQQRINE